VVQETGAYKGELQVKYEAILKQLAVPSRKLVEYANDVSFADGKMDVTAAPGFFALQVGMLTERARVVNTTEFLELKKAIEKM
jgi:hypothetical protein